MAAKPQHLTPIAARRRVRHLQAPRAPCSLRRCGACGALSPRPPAWRPAPPPARAVRARGAPRLRTPCGWRVASPPGMGKGEGGGVGSTCGMQGPPMGSRGRAFPAHEQSERDRLSKGFPLWPPRAERTEACAAPGPRVARQRSQVRTGACCYGDITMDGRRARSGRLEHAEQSLLPGSLLVELAQDCGACRVPPPRADSY